MRQPCFETKKISLISQGALPGDELGSSLQEEEGAIARQAPDRWLDAWRDIDLQSDQTLLARVPPRISARARNSGQLRTGT